MTNPTEADLLASGRSFLRCSCGFLAVGFSEAQNLIAFKQHRCTTAGPSKPWYATLSEDGWLVILLVAICAAVVLVAVLG